MPSGLKNPQTKKIIAVMVAIAAVLVMVSFVASFFVGRSKDPQLPTAMPTTTSDASQPNSATSPTTSGSGSATAPSATAVPPSPTVVADRPVTPPPTGAANPPPTAPPTACAFTITAPADQTKISASGGAVFSGTACRGDLIWILDFDPTDGPNGHYYQTNERPLEISDEGTWSFPNAPIGDKDDARGTVYPVVVLRVSPECSGALQGMPKDSSNTVRFTPLPASCPPSGSADHRTVRLVNDGP